MHDTPLAKSQTAAETSHVGIAYLRRQKGISSKAANSLTNKIKYNGKEEQRQEFSDGSGLDWLDYGARMLDNQIGRWMCADKLSEKSIRWSPYNYVNNNPLRYIDPDGNYIEDVVYNPKNGEITFTANGLKNGTDVYVKSRMATKEGRAQIIKMIKDTKKTYILHSTPKPIYAVVSLNDGRFSYTQVDGVTSGTFSIISSSREYIDPNKNPEDKINVVMVMGSITMEMESKRKELVEIETEETKEYKDEVKQAEDKGYEGDDSETPQEEYMHNLSAHEIDHALHGNRKNEEEAARLAEQKARKEYRNMLKEKAKKK